MSDDVNATMGNDGFGVELHAEYGFMLMLYGHHDVVFCAGCNVQCVGDMESCPGMVSSYDAACRSAEKYGMRVAVDNGGLSVYHASQVFDFCSVIMTDGLMSQANAQNGYLPIVHAEDVIQNGVVLRQLRTWRENDSVVLLQCLRYHLFIRYYIQQYLFKMALDEIDDIVGKRVVIVY